MGRDDWFQCRLAPRHPGVGLARPAREDRDETERPAS
jgi:hypothetical protein